MFSLTQLPLLADSLLHNEISLGFIQPVQHLTVQGRHLQQNRICTYILIY